MFSNGHNEEFHCFRPYSNFSFLFFYEVLYSKLWFLWVNIVFGMSLKIKAVLWSFLYEDDAWFYLHLKNSQIFLSMHMFVFWDFEAVEEGKKVKNIPNSYLIWFIYGLLSYIWKRYKHIFYAYLYSAIISRHFKAYFILILFFLI